MGSVSGGEMKKIKNYTTSVPANRSMTEIESILLDFGATDFLKQAVDKKFISLMFTLERDGRKIPFKVNANTERVAIALHHLDASVRTRKNKTPADFMDQAYRVAWRVIKDYVHSQLSLVEAGIMCLEESMVGNLVIDGKSQTTLSEAMIEGRLDRLIPEMKENK